MGAPDLTTAVAVALAESGGKYWIRVDPDGNGRWDHGLFQINDIHPELLKSGDPYDPFDNAVMARTIFVTAHPTPYRWTPWTAYNNGSYKQFLPRAEQVTS